MKNKTKKQTIELAPQKMKAMQAALKPVMKQLGLQPLLTEFSITAAKNGQIAIEFQQRKSNFTAAEVETAIFFGKFPRGMSCLDLAVFLANTCRRKNETALHLALSRGLLPPKTTLQVLLETFGLDKRRAIYALFDDYQLKPRYPADLTAADLAKVRSTDNGSLLHTAAIRGAYPRGTTVQDLLLPRDKFGMTPLHRAAQSGHLPPCTENLLKSVTNVEGRSPWWFAGDKLNKSYDPEATVRNILACPELAQRLRLERKWHREILNQVLTSPGLTPEIRTKLAAFPQVCAALL